MICSLSHKILFPLWKGENQQRFWKAKQFTLQFTTPFLFWTPNKRKQCYFHLNQGKENDFLFKTPTSHFPSFCFPSLSHFQTNIKSSNMPITEYMENAIFKKYQGAGTHSASNFLQKFNSSITKLSIGGKKASPSKRWKDMFSLSMRPWWFEMTSEMKQP